MPRKRIELGHEVEHLSILDQKGKLDRKREPDIDGGLLLEIHRRMLFNRRFDEAGSATDKNTAFTKPDIDLRRPVLKIFFVGDTASGRAGVGRETVSASIGRLANILPMWSMLRT